MSDVQFDANETVGGFTLIDIKRALSWVGIMDDRDDVKTVAKTLECSRLQAERVLAALERRGFVTKEIKKHQWKKTRLGVDLAVRWHPPRRLEPVVVRDDEGNPTNQMLESVPCSILRSDADDADVFEEADLEVGVFFEYESPRLIEISVSQPEDYEHRDESAVIETTVYLGAEEAKKFYKALGEAIESAEAELTRRATVKPRKKRRTASASHAASSASVVLKKEPATRAEEPASDMAAPAPRAAKTSSMDQRSALEATLKELRRTR